MSETGGKDQPWREEGEERGGGRKKMGGREGRREGGEEEGGKEEEEGGGGEGGKGREGEGKKELYRENKQRSKTHQMVPMKAPGCTHLTPHCLVCADV